MSRERRVHPSRLDSSDLPIVCELLSNVFSPGEPVRVLKVESPNPRVHRIDALTGGRRRRAFVKRSRADRARRNELVLTRWLPVAGLEELVPRLLGTVPGHADTVWAAYEDCGDMTLAGISDRQMAIEALDALGRLHAAFVVSPLLQDIARAGKPVDQYVFDSAAQLASVQSRLGALGRSGVPHPVREMLAALEAALSNFADALRLPAPNYGPMSLLHGDLYASNVVIDVQQSAGQARRVRIVDWDRAGAGPIAFDLAFLIGDIAPQWRRDSLLAYERRMQCHLSPWPSQEAWQQRFHRIALGRMVRAVSTCLDLADQGQQDYAMVKLAEARTWLEARWLRSS